VNHQQAFTYALAFTRNQTKTDEDKGQGGAHLIPDGDEGWRVPVPMTTWLTLRGRKRKRERCECCHRACVGCVFIFHRRMEKGSGGLGSVACKTTTGSWLVARVAVFCITAGFSSGVEAAGVAASAVRTLRRWRDFLVDGVSGDGGVDRVSRGRMLSCDVGERGWVGLVASGGRAASTLDRV
jgi:hypothetical protein